MKIIGYEISPPARKNFTPGVLETKNSITSVELNFHWPSLVKLFLEVPPNFRQTVREPLPFIFSDILSSECLDVTENEGTVSIILRINKKTKQKLPHYATHSLVVAGEPIPIRFSAKRARASATRRVDNSLSKKQKKNSIVLSSVVVAPPPQLPMEPLFVHPSHSNNAFSENSNPELPADTFTNEDYVPNWDISEGPPFFRQEDPNNVYDMLKI